MNNNVEYLLHKDIVLESVMKLKSTSLDDLECNDTDYTIFRKGSRSKAKIISNDVFTYLSHFKIPRRIVEAVKIESDKKNIDTIVYLKEVYKMTKHMVSDSFLVPYSEDSNKVLKPILEPGSMFKQFTVQKCLWLLEDTEVYELYNSDNKKCILKLGKKEFIHRISDLYKREAYILGLIDGDISPKIIEHGTHDECPYIIMEWCNGKPINKVLEGLLKEHTIETQRKIITILCKILKAYFELHGKGVIHGDVNHKNVLYTVDEEIKIIDFGNSFIIEHPNSLKISDRNGFNEFYDPQLVSAKLTRHKNPKATTKSDQYSIAAMIYFCITGEHYIKFSLNRDKMFNQILNESPRALSTIGFLDWPSWEEVITKALSKKEKDRFKDINSFLEEALKIKPQKTCIIEPYNINYNLIEKKYTTFIKEATEYVQLKEKVLEIAPISQFNYGLSGVAYGLYRLSKIEAIPELLSLADVWNTASLELRDKPNAYYSNEGEIILSKDAIGLNSIYHSEIGSIIVGILIAISMGDYATLEKSMIKLTSSIDFSCNNIDITTGYSGLLIGFQAILDAAEGTVFYTLTEKLVELGNRIVDIIFNNISKLLPIYKDKNMQFLGIAHGWAGILYSIMMWQNIDKSKYSSFILKSIEQLKDFSMVTKNGVCWPRKIPSKNKKQDYLTSWCNGSAGFVFFWLQAYESFNESDYLKYAISSGEYTWNTKEKYTTLDLCCGYTGKSYSFLALYKKTNDQKWLNRAKTFLSKAVISDPDGQYLKRNSLFKGDIGLAILCKEISFPDQAVMPLFERDK